MRNRPVSLRSLPLLLLALALGCSKSEAPRQEPPSAAPAASPAAGGAVSEGKALFERKCGVCHELARATARAETKEGWVKIVKDMQSKKPDWISDADAAKLIDYLAAEHGKR